jgi:steroid delta-isomerase-like uncharacterized protein
MKKLFYFLFSVLMLSSCASEQDSSNDKTSTNKERIQQFYDQLVNAHNANMTDSFFTSDFKDHQLPQGKIKTGSEGVKDAFNIFFTGFPDAHLDVQFMVAEGDTVISKVLMTGTNTGQLSGMQPTNRPIRIEGVAIFILKDGKIAERWRFFDDILMMQQLGVMPGSDATGSDK